MLATQNPKPSDPKQPPPKPGDPPHTPPKPGEPHQPHAASEGEEEQVVLGQGPAPRAVATAALMLTNSSIAPGQIWFEMTNTAAFALTVGVNTLTQTVPLGGAAWLSQFTDIPLMCAVFTPATFVADPGLPVPQSAVKLTNTAGSGLPATAGVRTVTVPNNPPSSVITITVYAQTAGNVAAGSRWFVCSVTGV